MARKIGCIGKCTIGLSLEDLSRITQNIEQTLSDPTGRYILRKYLIQGGRRDDLACLDYYETCSRIVSKEESSVSPTNSPSEEFTEKYVSAIYEAAELDGIPEITLALLERFSEAQNGGQRDVMLEVLKDAMTCASDHLRKSHTAFSRYAQQPCPRTK
ncbi:uncharacterized protein LOC107226456 [Neodiprion lecontei]|uniref:Uncharacterized protein LOC107226456 n=1 Tax=Neodiprion lecontei TaxID=441921 RepID=A0A6J0C607_NEOLC|nr:uncharacterized protein LOC107226456 [Neodiprion lecontei]XP_046427903.1 uncharacterized protein LOC124183449 [Neodiprion fabricii]